MSQIQDGDPCLYIPETKDLPFVAIGWLDSEYPFQEGKVQMSFFRKLCGHLKNRWHPPFACAGFHECGLCQFSGSESHFENFTFGSRSNGELYIPNGREIFVTPLAIAHYINAHRYLPPANFIEALMTCPPQGSVAYLKLLLESGGREWLRRLGGPPEEA